MFCHICGTSLPERAVFCPGCGRSLSDHPIVQTRGAVPVPEEAPSPAPVIPCEPAPESPVSELPITEESAFSEGPCPVDMPAEAPAPVQPGGEPQPPEHPQPTPEVPVSLRKRHPALIPVLIMAGLFLVGISSFFLFPFPEEDQPAETTSPVMEDSGRPSLPSRDEDGFASDIFVPTDEDCFEIDDGAVSFLPEKYRGGPILVIPGEIHGQTVTSIGNTGFHTLEGITTVILPDTLEAIEDNAFEGCAELRGIYIPSSVKTIGRRAFYGCISMESVSIPGDVSSIGTNAFDGCASLRYIFYGGSYEDWMELYNEYVTPFTYACCSDGDYYHGVYTP